MFFALMIIDGIFKNNQTQVDEYLNALNPLLRRTTEGNENSTYIKEIFFTKLTAIVSQQTNSTSNSSESKSLKARMIIMIFYFNSSSLSNIVAIKIDHRLLNKKKF